MYVGVTDRGWVQHLARQATLEEANFWQPSARSFKALPVGGLFLFKLHHPWNMIVGGGFFARHLVLPVDLAWDTFGEANGAASLAEVRARIGKYTHTPAGQLVDDHRQDSFKSCKAST